MKNPFLILRRVANLLVIGLFLFVSPCWAKVGVGIGTGNIILEEKLLPGTNYQLPVLTILNTGDEVTDYQMSMDFHQDQSQLVADESWFHFSPNKFSLEPGQLQTVTVDLKLPIKIKPGDYLVYLTSSPVLEDKDGQTAIGIAAAAKLYFSVAPAGFFQGLYYRLVSWWADYQPWTMIIILILFIVSLWLILKRAGLKVQIKFRKISNKKRK